MVKNILAAFLLFLAIPLAAQALTEDELKKQIADLLQRVTELQLQLGQGTSGGSTTSSSGSVLNGGLTLARELVRGVTGDDVSRLQTFLARDRTIYPTGEVTGLYGPLTESAVKRFQVACGIVTSGDFSSTGYGRVGPRTKRALQYGCDVGLPIPAEVGGLLRASPVTGISPLQVVAQVTVNTTQSCDPSVYTLDFGDGTRPESISVPAGTCKEIARPIPHTYAQGGIYALSLNIGSHKTTVKVTVSPGTNVVQSATDFATCASLSGSSIIASNPRQCRTASGSTFIEGVISQNNILSVLPNSGAAPLLVTAQFSIRAGDPYSIDWGDGTPLTTSGTLGPRQTISASSIVFNNAAQIANAQHTYTTSGSKTVTLTTEGYELESGQYVWRPKSYAKLVQVGTTPAGVQDSLTASVTSGAVPLSVPFTVVINGNGSCNGGEYTIDFGDGSKAALPYPADSCASRSFLVTHIFNTNGTYTVKLYAVRESQIANASPAKTINITAGSGATTVPFSVTPAVGGDFKKVEVRFTMPNACTGYTLLWGDNSTGVTRADNASGCPTATNDPQVFTHSYTTGGTYTIVLTVNGRTQNANITISN